MSSCEDKNVFDVTTSTFFVDKSCGEDYEMSTCVVSVENTFLKESKRCQTNFEENSAEAVLQNSSDITLPKTITKARSIALVATLTGANFLNILNFQSIVILLPMIGQDHQIREERQQWILGSSVIAFGCTLLLWGRIADLYSKRLIFIIGLVWLTVFTVIAPFVSNKRAFLAIRGFQGVGAAATVPTAIGILGVTFPPGRAKNYAFSAYAGGSPLGFFCGTILSCLIAQKANWRWVFGAHAIGSSINAVAAFFFIPAQPRSTSPPRATNTETTVATILPLFSLSKSLLLVDWIGAALITISIIGFIFTLIEGSITSWKAPWLYVVLGISCLLLGAFGFWEIHTERQFKQGNSTYAPLVKLSILRNTHITVAMIIVGLMFTAMSNYFVFTTFFLYKFKTLSFYDILLQTIPAGITGIVNTVLIAQLLDRIPHFFLMLIGIIGTSTACLLYAVPISPTITYFAYGFPAMLLVAAGPDATVPCVMLYISRALPEQEQAVAGALLHTIAQVSRTMGLAISTAVHTATMARVRHIPVGAENNKILPWDPASLAGLRAASWTNFGFGILALLLLLLVLRRIDGGKSSPAHLVVEKERGS